MYLAQPNVVEVGTCISVRVRVAGNEEVLDHTVYLRTESMSCHLGEVDAIVASLDNEVSPVALDAPDVRVAIVDWRLVTQYR